jgi:hypothetical protein
LQLPESSLADHLSRQAKSMVTALPRADLDNATRLADHIAEEFAFVDRQGKRFFTIDVLARTAGIEHHFGVPVIRGANQDDVDIGTFEQFAVVLENAGRAPKAGTALLADVTIDVTQRYHIAIHLGFVCDDRPLVTQANGAHTEPFDSCARFVGSRGYRLPDAQAGAQYTARRSPPQESAALDG